MLYSNELAGAGEVMRVKDLPFQYPAYEASKLTSYVMLEEDPAVTLSGMCSLSKNSVGLSANILSDLNRGP